MINFWELKAGDIIWQTKPLEEREYSQSAYMLYEAQSIFNSLPEGVKEKDLFIIEQVEEKEVKVALLDLKFSDWEVEKEKMVELHRRK